MMETNNNADHYSTLPFPSKLHRMLADSQILGFEHIVSWQPGGKSFKVHDPENFEALIMKEYFNQSKYKSFQRQLNIYGFKRVQTGPNKGGYIHKLFTEQTPELCDGMERKRPTQAGDPYLDACVAMSLIEPLRVSNSKSFESDNSKELDLEDSEVKTFYDFFFPADPVEKDFISSVFTSDSSLCEDVNVSDLKGMVRHGSMDTVDFSNFLPLLEESPHQSEMQTSVGVMPEYDERGFPWKVHLMLENAKKDNYQHIVSWVGDGSAFKVHNSKEFVEKVMPNYFDQTKYESFRRQLNLYGFARISRGADRGVISHPYLREGARWLCRNIKKDLKEEQLLGPC